MKRKPYKVKWSSGSFSLIPDAFLIFRMIVHDGRQRRVPIVIEHDRGSEEQQYFHHRIRAYLHMLRNEGYKELFGVGGITLAFSTSAGVERLKKMREWTARELEVTGETQFKSLFYFTLLERPIDPYQVWLNITWLPIFENQPVSLLGVLAMEKRRTTCVLSETDDGANTKASCAVPVEVYERMCSAHYAYRFGTIGFLDLLARFEEILGIEPSEPSAQDSPRQQE